VRLELAITQKNTHAFALEFIDTALECAAPGQCAVNER
jgi:hypothetical protein